MSISFLISPLNCIFEAGFTSSDTNYRRPSGPNEVIVTGTFDNWSKSYPLVKQTDGSFELNVPLDTSSEVLYKYVVDGEWTVNEKQKTVTDDSGNRNNVLETSALSASSSKTASRIPEAGGLAAVAGGVAAGGAASSSSHEKDLKTTVLPSTEGKQTTLGEPGIFVPQAKDTEALAAFETVRDVDPKTLNEPEPVTEEPFTKELTPEEKKKQKKKLKKTQYRLRKKQQKKAAAAGAIPGASGTGEDDSCDSEEEKTPEPESSNTTAKAAIIGAIGGAAAGGIGGAVLGAFGGASAGQAADEYAKEHHDEIPQPSTSTDNGVKTLDPGRQATLEIPGSIAGVDKVPTRDEDIVASKTRTIDTTTSSDFVDTQDTLGRTETAGDLAESTIPEEKALSPETSEDALRNQKENTKEYPVDDLTGSGAAAVPITAVEEPAAVEPTEAATEPTETSAPVSEEKAVEPTEPVAEEKTEEPSLAAPVAAGVLGGAGAAGVANAASAPAAQTSEPAVPVEPVSKEQAPVESEPAVPVEPVSKEQAAAEEVAPISEQPRAEGGEVAGVIGSSPAVVPTVGAKEVSAKEVDASPVTKGEDHRFDDDEEIIIAQGGDDVAAVERKIREQEGDVSVEEIQPTPSEARRLAEEAHLSKQAQIQAEKAQEAKTAPAKATPAKTTKATPKAQPSPKKAQKAPSAAQQEATKTKKSFLSKLKKIFK